MIEGGREDPRWARLVEQHRERQLVLAVAEVRPLPSPVRRFVVGYLGVLLAVPGIWMASRWLGEFGVVSRGVVDPVGRFWAAAYFVVQCLVLLLAATALAYASLGTSGARRVIGIGAAAVPSVALVMCCITGLDVALETDFFRL